MADWKGSVECPECGVSFLVVLRVPESGLAPPQFEWPGKELTSHALRCPARHCTSSFGGRYCALSPGHDGQLHSVLIEESDHRLATLSWSGDSREEKST